MVIIGTLGTMGQIVILHNQYHSIFRKDFVYKDEYNYVVFTDQFVSSQRSL